MKVSSLFPVLPARNLAESRDFYQGLGFMVGYADPRFLLLCWPDQPVLQLAFQQEGKRSRRRPLSRLAIEVTDVEAVYALLKDRGLAIESDIHDEIWGQRQFTILDPDKRPVDFFTQTEMAGP